MTHMGENVSRPLKVYIGSDGHRGRIVVAASSWAEVRRITGRSHNELRNYWSITGNQHDIAAAMERPGEVVRLADRL